MCDGQALPVCGCDGNLVSRLAGRAVAEIAAISAEYDWHRDPYQPIFYPQQANVPDTD
ncbi:hypothetical protein [Mycobacterium sp.]|uniref:hypothetical protein n=1 Tax=Mycobacterium sp. TaxID=1785 RepID=UPI003F99355B